MGCPLGFLFTILTILSIGITTGAVITAYVWLRVNHVESLSPGLDNGLMGGIVVSGLLLIFSIYASWCGKSCARRVLGVCFLIYALVFTVMACAIAWDSKDIDWIIDQAHRFWKEPNSFPNIAHKIEEQMNCQCWNNETCLLERDIETESCETKMKTEYHQNRFIIALAVGGVAGVMFIGVICAFVSACQQKKTASCLKCLSSTPPDENPTAW
jgi:hypothetical protein